MGSQRASPLTKHTHTTRGRAGEMRDNYELCIKGEQVLLVPYKVKFVEKYHSWMQDPYLLEMTASDPLPIQGEYDMQRSWKEDPAKCTFIVLARAALGQDTVFSVPGTAAETDELNAMAGDVNMFMNCDDPLEAELEIMIGEAKYRRMGLAREALRLMMHYGVTALGIWRFYVKIGEKNTVSLDMFKSLGFVQVNYVPAFQEYELQFVVSGNTINTTPNGPNMTPNASNEDVPCPGSGPGEGVANSTDDTNVLSGIENIGGSGAETCGNRDIILQAARHAEYVPYWDNGPE
ncbi:GNAT domain-containing protein [Ochromonadaceae sp. CCMP2298]|nr:GNAT domain-containing protein [Ochromonadaceae sp. CCMP2298]|mmetsp:Transcript_1810/g.3727  ORF Transcript_1810/g.3727 Transcript_1810/m.3727 type:complete len:291 (+) Transcript_1810:324-1196(+)|eukprot:CAMPEP_0173204796 /NCGR_PEP_ID=MMETSP1141-20130122/20344_1 /TAXON_ID=483371 /ORGANISM="non described non described, Strain CCMP2298" /LENGTH=290 /DNA_ID=CAMNT_0014130545 /DNA_START=246 /DNA_END=1118 /DNA_ORIENTATION=+